MSLFIYDSRGELRGPFNDKGRGAADEEVLALTGSGYAEGDFSPELHYWNGSSVFARPTHEVLCPENVVIPGSISVTGIQDKTDINVKGPTGNKYVHYTGTEPLEVLFDEPGTYTITFECWPYKKKEVVVNATES